MLELKTSAEKNCRNSSLSAPAIFVRISICSFLKKYYKVLQNLLCCITCMLAIFYAMVINCLKLRPAERICMSKFRCGNHNLPLSVHRNDRDNNPIGMIVTIIPNHFCLTGERGDKFHHVLVCSFFSTDGKMLIRSYSRVSLILIYLNSES